jgi:hypothetical protein
LLLAKAKKMNYVLGYIYLALTLNFYFTENENFQSKVTQRLINPLLTLDLSQETKEPIVFLTNQERKKQNQNRQEMNVTENEKPFQKLMRMAIARQLSEKQIDIILQTVAEQFLGASYQAGLLDKSDRETLLISLDRFDCVLFVETVLALTQNIAAKQESYWNFENRILNIRYRDGILQGYCSRLHYFSDWLDNNQKRGNLQNLTVDLGGIPLNKKINFMSSHRHLYRQLKEEANYQCIVGVEEKLNTLKINYIPTQNIKSIYPRLRKGDIIAIVTNIPGLDVTHTGLIYKTSEGNIGLIHASPIGKVAIAPDLQRYTSKVENAIGIIVARPIAP